VLSIEGDRAGVSIANEGSSGSSSSSSSISISISKPKVEEKGSDAVVQAADSSAAVLQSADSSTQQAAASHPADAFSGDVSDDVTSM
jgi:hypothetical protein